MRDKEDPEVTAYLEAENAYAEAVMAPLAGLRENLYEEMLSHIKQTDVSVPFRDGAWWYYTRTEEGLQYAIHCRKPGTVSGPDSDAPEHVVLDGNELAKGHAFFAIGETAISEDGNLLAYTTDTTGFRQYTLHIKNLATGETLPERSSASARWCGRLIIAHSSTPWKTKNRSANISYGGTRSVLRMTRTCLVYQDDDERFNVAAGRTRDGKFLVLESASHITTECWALACRGPARQFTAHQRARETSTSTPSTTAMVCGLSAPTIVAAIFAW